MSASAVSPRTAAALQATLDRVKALQTLDPSLSVADAAQMVAALPPRSSHQRDLQAVEKSLPTFQGNEHESPVDYLAQVEQQFDQYSINDPADQLALLAGKLRSKALRHYRVNKSRLNTYAKLTDSLKEHFCLTEHAVAAALSSIAYNPALETFRAFNERFNNIGESGTSALPTQQLIKLYLAALARGDSELARDLIMARDVQTSTVAQLQKALQSKMDQISVVYNKSGVSMDSSGKAYKQAKNTLAIPPDGGVNQVKAAQGMQEAAIASLTRALSLQAQPATTMPAGPPSQASAPVGQQRGLTAGGKRACFKCGSEEHLAANCPQRVDWGTRKQVVSKAVGLMMDEFEREDTHLPANFTGVTIPGHAYRLLTEETSAPDLPQKLGTFAAAVLAYASDHPNDKDAQVYATKAKLKGDELVDELLQLDNPLFERILAEIRTRSARTQTAEGGNVAVALQPSISDILSGLPSKVNLLDWLRNSEVFCRNLLELCIEISMDKGWKLDFDIIINALKEGRRTRKYGEYIADIRAQTRLHQLEQARVAKEKMKRSQDAMSEDSELEEGEIRHVFSTHSKHDERMKADVDYTALAGPPTAHEYVTVIVSQGGKRYKVKAIRDTGSPDTIISSKLAEMLHFKIDPTNETFGVLGNVSSSYVGTVQATLTLTERIQVDQRIFVGNDRIPILLIGNDVFNKDRVVIMGSSYDAEVHTIALGDQMDVLPFKLMTTKERASVKAATPQAPYKKPQPLESDTGSTSTGLTYEEMARRMVALARQQQGVTGLIMSPTPYATIVEEEYEEEIDRRAKDFVSAAFLGTR